MYEFIRGPMMWASFAICILGMGFQMIRFFVLTKKIEMQYASPPIGYKPKAKIKLSRKTLPSVAAMLRVSIIGFNPMMLFVTIVFHTSIFILPLLLMEHSILLDTLWGIDICPCVFSETASDILTGVIMLCILFFLYRRIFLSHVRSISTVYDYFIILLTSTPFITGYLAVHGFFDYRTLIILHLLSVNLILMSLPFAKFMHAVFFFLNRFFLENEYSLTKGSRNW